MGTDGLQVDVGDKLSAVRLNRKSLFVGTGAQIAALTTYPHMMAGSTTTESGFIINNRYRRNVANTFWFAETLKSQPNLRFTADSITPVVTLHTFVDGFTNEWNITSIATTTKNLDFQDVENSAITAISDDCTSYDTDGNFDTQWISSDTVVNNSSANNNIAASISAVSQSSRSTYDFGASVLSDVLFEVRAKVTITSFNTGAGAHDVGVYVSNTNAGPRTTTHDGYGMSIRSSNSANTVQMMYADNNDLFDSPTNDTAVGFTPTATTYWLKMRLSNSSFTVQVFADNSYKSALATKSVAVSGTITGLRYLMIGAASNAGGSTGTLAATFTDIQYFNGV